MNTTVWITGLSGAGKTTISNELSKLLIAGGMDCCVLDGDVIRTGLNSNLGFSKSDRSENCRRVAEVAKILNSVDVAAIVSVISPFDSDRKNARSILSANSRFILVYLSTSLAECMRRDVNGLYKKAADGNLNEFTGIGSDYEKPTDADIVIDTTNTTTQECVDIIIRYLCNEDINTTNQTG